MSEEDNNLIDNIITDCVCPLDLLFEKVEVILKE